MLISLVLAALADIPPPEGYVETCTVAVCEGAEAQLCGDSYYGDMEACSRKWAPEGYTKACRTGGASVWNEVWCRTGEPAPSETEPADADTTATEAEPTPVQDDVAPAQDEAAPAQADADPTPPSPKRSSRCSAVAAPAGAIVWLVGLAGVLTRRRRA